MTTLVIYIIVIPELRINLGVLKSTISFSWVFGKCSSSVSKPSVLWDDCCENVDTESVVDDSWDDTDSAHSNDLGIDPWGLEAVTGLEVDGNDIASSLEDSPPIVATKMIYIVISW